MLSFLPFKKLPGKRKNDTPYYLGLSILSTIGDAGDNDTGDNVAYKKPERQKLSAEARRILSLFEGRPLEESDIAREAQGRPFFPAREADCMRRTEGSETNTLPKQQPQVADFSITHSGVLAAVSYTRGKNLRTGCDVERVRPRAGAGKIAEKSFSATEKNYVFPQGKFDETRFYEIWVLKECYIKLRGLSVFDMAACPSFISEKNEFAFGAAVSRPLSFYLYELSGSGERYILAAALEGTEPQQPEIRWFSQSPLAYKMLHTICAAIL